MDCTCNGWGYVREDGKLKSCSCRIKKELARYTSKLGNLQTLPDHVWKVASSPEWEAWNGLSDTCFLLEGVTVEQRNMLLGYFLAHTMRQYAIYGLVELVDIEIRQAHDIKSIYHLNQPILILRYKTIEAMPYVNEAILFRLLEFRRSKGLVTWICIQGSPPSYPSEAVRKYIEEEKWKRFVVSSAGDSSVSGSDSNDLQARKGGRNVLLS